MARKITPQILESLKKARSEVREAGAREPVPRANLGSARLNQFIMFLDREAGQLRPRVCPVDIEHVTVENQAMADDLNNQLSILGKRRPPPPYIITNRIPTWEECVELHSLNELQTFAFRLVMKTLLDEKAGKKPDQLRMCTSGQVSFRLMHGRKWNELSFYKLRSYLLITNISLLRPAQARARR